MTLPYCVYILFSEKDKLLYTGFTTNIDERIKHHNAGKTKSTAPRRPLLLIFCEFYLFEADARKREMYFKTNPGKKAIKLMLGSSLLRLGYNRTQGIRVINEELDHETSLNQTHKTKSIVAQDPLPVISLLI